MLALKGENQKNLPKQDPASPRSPAAFNFAIGAKSDQKSLRAAAPATPATMAKIPPLAGHVPAAPPVSSTATPSSTAVGGMVSSAAGGGVAASASVGLEV